MNHKRPKTLRFVCFRVSPKTKRVQRDYASCPTLEAALDLLMPGHVEAGWKVREELPRSGLSPLVTRTFDVAVEDGHAVVIRERILKQPRSYLAGPEATSSDASDSAAAAV